MSAIKIDFNENKGTIKPLHGMSNSPIGYGSLIDVSHYFKELAIPYVRLHDPNWPHPREVDIPQIFPNFDADPNDPANYEFDRTDAFIQQILDTGAKIVYRLGVSIEHTDKKYYTHPPNNFNKWTQICLGIIKHYNQGWANGFFHNIEYWEIWNEPENGDHMWSGTFEQYLELYATAAKTIKAFNPALKIGGFATSGLKDKFIFQFLAYCQKHKLPLDFFSWHKYGKSPNLLASTARKTRSILDQYGYGDTESHLNEWNYWTFRWEQIWKRGNEYMRRESFEKQKNEEGASFVAASLILLQDQPVDILNYYDGQPISLFCGIFDYYGVPQKTFYAFKAFREMLDYPERVKSEVSANAAGLYSLAALNREKNQAAILISNFNGTMDEYGIRIQGLPLKEKTVYEVYLLDEGHNLELVKSDRFKTHDTAIKILLHKHAVALIKIR
jgi:hypothetical protein